MLSGKKDCMSLDFKKNKVEIRFVDMSHQEPEKQAEKQSPSKLRLRGRIIVKF